MNITFTKTKVRRVRKRERERDDGWPASGDWPSLPGPAQRPMEALPMVSINQLTRSFIFMMTHCNVYFTRIVAVFILGVIVVSNNAQVNDFPFYFFLEKEELSFLKERIPGALF